MKDLKIQSNPAVKLIFDRYPEAVRHKLLYLRELVLETAKETEEILKIEETLKWGEPSYLTKVGSTIRIDWKAKTPDQYAMYFKCTSLLVVTFKQAFKNTFKFEGNRAIIFELKDPIPVADLKCCIKTALRYHRVKHLPILGIKN